MSLIINTIRRIDGIALCNYPLYMGNLPISNQALVTLVSLAFASVLVLIYRKVIPIIRQFGWVESGKSIEGAPRAVYPVFTILVLWASYIFLLPMALGYREEIAKMASSSERLAVMAKILFAPFVFLVVLSYGAKRGFLNWIRDLKWPNNEPDEKWNRHKK